MRYCSSFSVEDGSTLESVNIEMKATDQYFTRILFIMQQKVVVNSPSVEEILDSSFAW